MKINFEKIIPKFDAILERGLCSGIGEPNSQMCIEAAITQAMGLPFNDEPTCVTKEIRIFKIALNDKNWSSPTMRAKGLRNLGIAQIGSQGIVDGNEFLRLLSKKLIQKLIPHLFRKVFTNKNLLQLADFCEMEPTILYCRAAAYATANAAHATFAAAANTTYATTYTAAAAATYAAAAAAAYAAANAAAYAADATYAAAAAAAAAAYAAAAIFVAVNGKSDFYLIFVANLALETLKELKSPGCDWI